MGLIYVIGEASSFVLSIVKTEIKYRKKHSKRLLQKQEEIEQLTTRIKQLTAPAGTGNNE